MARKIASNRVLATNRKLASNRKLATNRVSTGSLSAYIQSLSGLIAYYQFNETSGNALNTAPATIGTLDGTLTGVTQNVSGQIGSAYLFNGTTGLITVADANALDLTTNFSVISIVKPTTFGGGGVARMFDKQAGAASAYFFAINSTGSLFLLARDGSNTINANGNSVTTGVWQMLVASYNGSNVSYYRNGVAVGTPASITVASANTTNLTIGNRAAADRGWNGQMQHIGLRNATTSAAEALAMAQLAGLA